jgi:predicted metalloprotease with PDZ domain
VAGADFNSWFRLALETTEEPITAKRWSSMVRSRRKRLAPVLRHACLQALRRHCRRTNTGRSLRRGTATYNAGFNVNDEVIGVHSYRVRAEQWPAHLENYKPGQTVDV